MTIRLRIAISIWLGTSFVFGIGWLTWCLFFSITFAPFALLAFIASVLGSLPVFIILLFTLPWIQKKNFSTIQKMQYLFLLCFICTLPYSLIAGLPLSSVFHETAFTNYIYAVVLSCSVLFGCSSLCILLTKNKINNYFSSNQTTNFMEQNQFENADTNFSNATTQQAQQPYYKQQSQSNKTLFKGLITGALILLMLIPTVFVSNLVSEREQRQNEVAKEVTNGWSTQQTLSGPYLYIPYLVKEGEKSVTKNLYILPENLSVNGIINPEIRPRSIYKILLYRSDIKTKGSFNIQLPKDIEPNSLLLNEAKICYGVSDFKGIEEKLNINFNGTNYGLTPGLPVKQFETITIATTSATQDANRTDAAMKEIESIGLSTSVNLSVTDLQKPLYFDMQLKIKGSEKLHFLPLSGNSNFEINSSWKDPKFDGNNLPNSRDVSEKGFQAKWSFNNANLPFATTIKDFNFNKQNLAFGVSMVQPADQYAKTMRSVKYAILFIGLTIALFFIIELLQKKPVHPVQYVLIGIALVIFFTLLLSISEFILFDYAYLIAAAATILLIASYAKSHFKSIKTASIFGSLLSCLYTFIFVLIRLEDAALLVGSIGLFIILALVMFGSRKVNWYGNNTNN